MVAGVVITYLLRLPSEYIKTISNGVYYARPLSRDGGAYIISVVFIIYFPR